MVSKEGAMFQNQTISSTKRFLLSIFLVFGLMLSLSATSSMACLNGSCPPKEEEQCDANGNPICKPKITITPNAPGIVLPSTLAKCLKFYNKCCEVYETCKTVKGVYDAMYP